MREKKPRKPDVNISVNRSIKHYLGQLTVTVELDTFSLSEKIDMMAKEDKIREKELELLNKLFELGISTEQKVKLSKFIHTLYEQK